LDDEFCFMITGHEAAYIRNPSSKPTLQADLNKEIKQENYYSVSRRQFNPLTPGLNLSEQRCLTRYFYWGFCFLDRAFR
jgi:hypothetical protein